MAAEEWKPMKASPEKFLKAENYLTIPFSGVLEAIYPSQTQGEKAVGYIKLDFEGGSSLGLFGFDKQNDDGTYPFGLGSFIKSAEALGLEIQEAEMDGVVQGIRLLENDMVLEKPKLWIRGIEEKGKVGDTQAPSYFNWGILEKYEVTTAQPAKKKGGYPAIRKPKPTKEQTSPGASSALADALLEAGVVGENISDVFAVTFGKKYKVNEIRAALATVGLEVAQNGVIQKQQG